nr:alpha/beta family hydrolase [Pseudofrankia asymbiotica]
MATSAVAQTTVSVDGGRLLVVPDAGQRLAASAGGAAGGALGTPVVVLLHGAGSGTDTPLLRRLSELLVVAGVTVGRLEMPYRVAGRKAPDRPARLDAVLMAAVAALTGELTGGTPPADGTPRRLALAGASMGSRVAVRTATAVGARAVLALGFPLNPPPPRPSLRERPGTPASRRPSLRESPGAPARDRPSRQGELSGAGVPVRVIQGERDAFGRPEPDPRRGVEVVVVAGADHSFKVRVRDGRAAEEVIEEAAVLGATWLLRWLDVPSSPVGGLEELVSRGAAGDPSCAAAQTGS